MKKVLCASEIESAYTNNENNIEIDSETIITPLAQDLIDEYELNVEVKPVQSKNLNPNSISKELILSILKKILNDNFLTKLDSNGLKVIDGDSLVFQDIPNCLNNGTGKYCNFHLGDRNQTKFGLVKLANTELTNIAKANAYLYISSGCFDISIGQDSCVAKQGDIIFIPKGVNVTIKVLKEVKFVYSINE